MAERLIKTRYLKARKKYICKASGKSISSWLQALFLIDQGTDISHIEKGNPLEITPANLFHGNLGNKRILFHGNLGNKRILFNKKIKEFLLNFVHIKLLILLLLLFLLGAVV